MCQPHCLTPIITYDLVVVPTSIHMTSLFDPRHNIWLHYTVKPPKIFLNTHKQLLEPGATFALFCVVFASPPFRITWYFDGVLLVDGWGHRRVKVVTYEKDFKKRKIDLIRSNTANKLDFFEEREGVVSGVVMEKVSVEDGGVYSCEVQTRAGVKRKKALINVKGDSCVLFCHHAISSLSTSAPHHHVQGVRL